MLGTGSYEIEAVEPLMGAAVPLFDAKVARTQDKKRGAGRGVPA